MSLKRSVGRSEPLSVEQCTAVRAEASGNCRRLESVENQTEQLGRASADAREVDGLREDAFKERLTAIEKSMRDVSRNVQIVKDRQAGHITCTTFSEIECNMLGVKRCSPHLLATAGVGWCASRAGSAVVKQGE